MLQPVIRNLPNQYKKNQTPIYNTTMITEKYLKCLKELQDNPNIQIGEYSETNYFDCEAPSERFLKSVKSDLEEENILISDKDLEYFNLVSIVLNWDDKLKVPTNVKILRGGFVFNDISDSLTFPTDYFENTVNVKDDGEYSEKLG